MKTIFKSRKKWVLLIAVLLLCGTLVFALRDWYLPSAAASGTDPTEKNEKENPPPEDGEFWIKDIEGVVTLKDEGLMVQFAGNTLNVLELDWYKIVSEKTGNTRFYRADVMKKLSTPKGYDVTSKDCLYSVAVHIDGRLRPNCENPAGDGPVTGLVLQYYVVKEHRLYNVKALLREEHLALIANKSIAHTMGTDEISDRLRIGEDLVSRGVFEERVHCSFDNYFFSPIQ